ncbi:MAG: kynureninase [Firmicutes bacterium]|nr:kynureninase [Bacillota bacterium]
MTRVAGADVRSGFWEEQLAHAKRCDADDELRAFRDRFYVAPERIYLDGNSLGLLSHEAEAAVLRVLGEWREQGIDGWSGGAPPWYDLAERLAPGIAGLVGAREHEVIATGSTTVNLHQLLATFYRPQTARQVLLVDAQNFPSDLYAAQSHVALHGGAGALHPGSASQAQAPESATAPTLRVVPGRDGLVGVADLMQALGDDVAVAFFSSVQYRSGQLMPIREIVERAHRVGAIVGFDLSHGIGAVPHQLHDDGVDFAFWCHYKYLGSGPGAVGGLFVHERHHERWPGLAGWWGSHKERQFDMAPTFDPASGVGRFQIGTPHLLSLAPLEGSLKIFAEAGIGRIRDKSLALTELLMTLVDGLDRSLGFSIETPRNPGARGGHVAVRHMEAARVAKALKARGIIPDFRPPDVVRLAPVALYTRFEDVVTTVRALEQIVTTREHERFDEGRAVIA